MYVDEMIRRHKKDLEDGKTIEVSNVELKAFNDFPIKFRKMIESFGNRGVVNSYDFEKQKATYRLA